MIKLSIIVFREMLEIALLVGAILGIFKNVTKKYIYLGIFLGVLGSCIFGSLFNYISNLFDGDGNEYFSIITLLASIILISFTLNSVNNPKQQMNEDTTFNASFVLLIASSIFREGIEIYLYTSSVLMTTKIHIYEVIFALFFSTSGALFLGYLIIVGINKIPLKYLFKITSLMLIFIGASFSVSLVTIIDSLGYIDIYNFPLWDSSFILSESTFIGTFLNTLFGYISKPTIWHILTYLFTAIFLYKSSKIRFS